LIDSIFVIFGGRAFQQTVDIPMDANCAPLEVEIKDTTDTDTSASYLDLHLEIDSEWRLRTKLYNKRDDFIIHIVNFPFICSNIPAAHAYAVYISQLIQYFRA